MFRQFLKFFAGIGMVAAVACSAQAPAPTPAPAQTLSPKWEDLTSADFVKALQASGGLCMLPLGSLEKFGPSGPIGTNLYLARLIALEAAKKEYAIIFPEYYASAATNTSGLPGTISYSPHLILELLDETTHEMARNGCKKILIVNGHSGNTSMLSYYLSTFTQEPHDYVVYTIYGPEFPVFPSQFAKLPPAVAPSKPGVDGHGGEERISAMLAYYPDLVHLDRAHDEPSESGHVADQGAPQAHLAQGFMSSIETGYSGDAAGATAARGKANVELLTARLVTALQQIKADNTTLETEKKFYQQRENPEAAK